MRNYIYLVSLCLVLAACGTHRKAMTQSVPVQKQDKPAKKTVKAEIEYEGQPWVTNMSKPFDITHGLQNKHIAVWASHGRYYSHEKGRWKWQRPQLYCTTEDLFTQTIVVPYLMPMLENAGAVVFSPRERDWQKNEIIIDNDDQTKAPYFTVTNISRWWEHSDMRGYAASHTPYDDQTNPFRQGTTMVAEATTEKGCEISYQPRFTQAGRYAVYVSYPTHKKSVPDAQYVVYHQGRRTVFNVNQRMGGGTWVYLGTFDFGTGCSSDNRVVLTNQSRYDGVVTADAVRFGGGMGLIQRGGTTSGLPKCLEGARYYAQWAGAPENVYRTKDGIDDYREDIYARPYMTNWIAGGSCYAPSEKGLGVPIELALAVHSDAGYSPDYTSLVGSLAICTTDVGDGLLASGASRYQSKSLADLILNGLNRDIIRTYGNWNRRYLYDRNYAETRCPIVPSAIIETLSHQNFPDMLMGHDPNFKFTVARSLYKSILRFCSAVHSTPCVIAPLAPVGLCAEFASADTLILRWEAQTDTLEPTAVPTTYVLYTSIGGYGFDNGIRLRSTACKIPVTPNTLYRFKVTAVNDGGESFASETVAAAYDPTATRTVLIVDGFQRLAPPAAIDNATQQGFDLSRDPGVSYGKTLGFSGAQLCFDKSQIGIEGPGGLGYSGNEMEGRIIMGNTLDNTTAHAKAIMAAGGYNVASCTRQALERGVVRIDGYDCVDLVLGLERDDHRSLKHYKTFTPQLRAMLSDYARRGGSLLVSGAYVASDMTANNEREFLANTLHAKFGGTSTPAPAGIVSGMGTMFDIYATPNENHYAATSVDILTPVSPAFCALTNHNGNSVCVAYKGKRNRTFTMGFPFECIKSEKKQATIMKGILDFLCKGE